MNQSRTNELNELQRKTSNRNATMSTSMYASTYIYKRVNMSINHLFTYDIFYITIFISQKICH